VSVIKVCPECLSDDIAEAIEATKSGEKIPVIFCRNCEWWDKLCAACDGPRSLKNPSGHCDHSCYSDYIEKGGEEHERSTASKKDAAKITRLIARWRSLGYEIKRIVAGKIYYEKVRG
jgi:hypothetical protein